MNLQISNLIELGTARGLTGLDALALTIIAIVMPIYATISLKRNPIEKMRKDPNIRRDSYNLTLLHLWGQAGLIIGIWLWLARPFTDLAFRHELNVPTLIVWVVAILGIAFSAYQLHQVIHSDTARAKISKQLQDVGEHTALLMPKTVGEHRHSMLVAITAGITEEIIFRGYLIWSFGLFMHSWLAGFLSVCVFVFLHRYQDRAGLIQVAAFAIVSTIMVLVSGSLWPAIILHIGVDMLNISLAWQIGKRSEV